MLFAANPAIFGFTTSFGEPISAKVYFDPKRLNPQEICAIINSPELKIKTENAETIQKIDFKAKITDDKFPMISATGFYQHMIPTVDDTFDKIKAFKPEDISIYEIAVTSINKNLADQLSSLQSHVLGDSAVVGFKTLYRNDSFFIQLPYSKSLATPADLYKLITRKKLTVMYSDGSTEEEDNHFTFSGTGK
jgi:hypothetical protein